MAAASEAEKAMSALLDENILTTLQAKNQNGTPLTAAEINAITNRLKSEGVAAPATKGSTTHQIIEEMRKQNFEPKLVGTMPAVDMDHDDAATA